MCSDHAIMDHEYVKSRDGDYKDTQTWISDTDTYEYTSSIFLDSRSVGPEKYTMNPCTGNTCISIAQHRICIFVLCHTTMAATGTDTQYKKGAYYP